MSGPAPVWPGAPRLAPARPFPRSAYLPGRSARPPARAIGPAREEVAFGVDLYHAGYFWEAHEAWEGPWKRTRSPARKALLQGLIQLAAALLKLRLREARGAHRLLHRARRRLCDARALRRRCLGLDVAALLGDVEALARRPALAAAPRLRVEA